MRQYTLDVPVKWVLPSHLYFDYICSKKRNSYFEKDEALTTNDIKPFNSLFKITFNRCNLQSLNKACQNFQTTLWKTLKEEMFMNLWKPKLDLKFLHWVGWMVGQKYTPFPDLLCRNYFELLLLKCQQSLLYKARSPLAGWHLKWNFKSIFRN